jgi:uncharacterized protein (TIGR02302 family)
MAELNQPAGKSVTTDKQVLSSDRSITPTDSLTQKITSARKVMVWEQLWAVLVPPLAIIALFLGVSWLGLWQDAPRWARIVGTSLFFIALIASLKGFLKLRPVAMETARMRLDRESGIAHRPVEAVSDRLGSSDSAEAKALWALHQKRALAAVESLKVPKPDPAMRRLDPKALRFAPFLLALAGIFVAGPEMAGRVGAAFQWFEPVVPPPPPRLDVWLDPPSYTGRPPQFLVRSQSPESAASQATAAKAPVGSILVVRATPAEGIAVEVSGELKAAEVNAEKPGDSRATTTMITGTSFEKRFTLSGDGEVVVRRGREILGQFKLAAIPDTGPTIALIDVVQTESRDGLRVIYNIKDDYGVKEAEARFSVIRKPGEEPRRTLLPAPSAALALPSGGQGDVDSETTISLAEHPWAGARVKLQLYASDDAGQSATSQTRDVTIPQKFFSNPLAKALVEQRSELVLDPDRKGRVQIAIDALMIEPERFLAKQTGAYLGLQLASKRLRRARTDEQLIEVADWLWTMALEIEGDGLSDAEKALREAQERLSEALDRNASADEIKRLTDELRRAMDRYMREFAERAERNGEMAERQNNENMKMLDRNDMQKMLEEIEKLSREGKHAEAQELLRQLNEAMKNLQAQRGQPGQRGQQGERQRGMNEAMNELDQMTREEQQLRDQTFREGQDRRRRDQRAERNRQQGQQGQQGQRGQQPGGQDPGDGEQESAENGESQGEGQGQGQGQGQGGQSLQQRQERLRQQMERLQRRMRDLGMSGEKGLADAEQAMRDAEGQLGQGQEGRAVDSQGRALEGMRRGMQGMAQQQQQQQGGDGTEQADGGPGGDDPNRPGQPRANSGNNNNRDPLGRNNSRSANDNNRMQMQGHEGGTVGERARRVLEELRRKLGEQERPRLELDYFERLLPKN